MLPTIMPEASFFSETGQDQNYGADVLIRASIWNNKTGDGI